MLSPILTKDTRFVRAATGASSSPRRGSSAHAASVSISIDPLPTTESRENARQANVIDRIRFLNEDLFVTDVGDATVVTLFLSPGMNLAVRPQLQRELKRGTRIVSHWHHMGDWKPQETVRV